MNGGRGSTLSVGRNPIPRPVSFHSLPEHHHNNPVHLSPYSHRRPRTPRSSPLTGPSLSSDQVDTENKDDERNQKPRYRPNRISSTPDMVAPIQSIYDSDSTSLSSPPSTISIGTYGVVVPIPPLPKPSGSSSSDEEKESGKGEDRNRLRSLAKRLSIISTSSMATDEKGKDDQKPNKRRSSFILTSSSTTSLASTSSSRTVFTDRTSSNTNTAPPMPTIPRWALNAMREEAGEANRQMKYGHRRGTSDELPTSSPLPPLPNQPIPRGILPSASGLSNQPRPPSISRDPSENWMSVTDPIPKFSRLGIRGDAVVMPVKKKESLARMKSAGSIASTRSAATLTQSAAGRGDNGLTTKIESSSVIDSGNDSNATDTKPNLKEKEGLRKRTSSLASSLRSKIPKIIVSSSAGSENVPPLPPSTNTPDYTSTPITTSPISVDPPPEIVKTSVSPPSTVPPPITRRSVTLRRDSVLAAIDENQPPLPNETCTEFGSKPGDVKSQDTRARRKSIKQIVMRITTSPTCAGKKVKLTTIRDLSSTPGVVALPPLEPLVPPPSTRFGKRRSSSLPSLSSTKEVSEFNHSQTDLCGHVRFKSIRKRWNTVLATVRSKPSDARR